MAELRPRTPEEVMQNKDAGIRDAGYHAYLEAARFVLIKDCEGGLSGSDKEKVVTLLDYLSHPENNYDEGVKSLSTKLLRDVSGNELQLSGILVASKN